MNEFECKICNKNFSSEDSLKQHNGAKHIGGVKRKANPKKYFIWAIIALIVLFGGLSVRNYAASPGEFDDFAKCLTEKGAVMYGNDFCQYTRGQMNFFGKSKQYINYIKCINNEELCNSKGVKVTPTWEIEGKMYEQVQTFEKLSALSGCEI